MKYTPLVDWIVNERGVELFGKGGIAKSLGYPDAALWDLLTRRYSEEALIEKLSYISSSPQLEAQAWVLPKLAAWVDQGLIEPRVSANARQKPDSTC